MPTARRPLSLVLLALSTCAASAPGAQSLQLGGILTGLDIDRIVQIAAAYGPAERRTDEFDGSAWIRAESDGIIYSIAMRNCQDGQNCTSVQFRAWWNSEGAHTLQAMNDWNRERRFSSAYLDSDDNATISYDVNLAGGVTAVNFDDTVQWWLAVLDEFRGLVIDPGYAAAASGQTSMPMPPAETSPVLSK